MSYLAKKQQAFTLVEVLIASSILFMVIAVTVIGFSNSRQNAAIAASRIAMHQPIGLILDQVENALRPVSAEQLNGEGQLGEVSFKWQANLHSRHTAPVLFDSETGAGFSNNNVFMLFDVTIELRHGNASREYQYQKLGWQKP